MERGAPKHAAEVGVTVVKVIGTGRDRKEIPVKADSKEIPIILPPGVNPIGMVGQSKGMTINMGNFESVRVDGWATFPVIPASELKELMPLFNDAWNLCKDWLDDVVGAELNEVKKKK